MMYVITTNITSVLVPFSCEGIVHASLSANPKGEILGFWDIFYPQFSIHYANQ